MPENYTSVQQPQDQASSVIVTSAPEIKPVNKENFIKRLLNKISHLNRKRLLITSSLILLIITAGLGYWYFFLRGGKVRVVLGSVSITAEKKDLLGVDPTSAFIIKSKEGLNLAALKANLRIKPVSAYEIKRVNDNEFRLTFDQPLAENKIYQFELSTEDAEVASGSAKARDLSWAFQIKTSFRIVQTLPRDKATNVPLNSGIELTFSHENYSDIKPSFEITPHVDGRFEKHKRVAVFVPKSLEPETLYTVKIKKGVKLDGSDESLKDDVIFQFETQSQKSGSLDYNLGFVRTMSEFPSNEKPAFSLYYYSNREPESLDVNVYKFKDKLGFVESLKEKDKVPQWSYFYKNSFIYDTKNLQQVMSFSAPVQKLDYNGYFIFPETLDAGYYLVNGKSNNKNIQTWLQITDIATYLSNSDTKTIIWINDVSNKKEVKDATVKLISDDSIYKTNDQGVAFFDTPKSLKTDRTSNYYEVSTSNGKSAIVPVYTNEYSYYGGFYNIDEGESSKSEKYWSYLYLDRPIYLPTDTVNFWGVIKDRDNQGLTEKLKITFSGSDYIDYFYNPVTIFEQELKVSDLGTFIGQIPLKNLSPGYYSVNIKLGEENIVDNYFTVETYAKPAYKIDVEAEKKAIFAGETANFKGKVTFFEGTAVPNVGLKYSSNTGGSVETDEKGEFRVSVPTTYEESAERLYYGYPDTDYIYVTPSLPEEGEIDAGSSVFVFGPKVTIKTEEEIDGNQALIKIVANKVTLDRINNGTAKDSHDYLDDPFVNSEIKGQVYESHWEKNEKGEVYDFINKVTTKIYDYKEVKTLQQEILLKTDDKGEAVLQFGVGEDKFYTIELMVGDGEGRTARRKTYLYGRLGRFPGAEDSNYYHLASNSGADKPYFSVGEEVSLTLLKGQDGQLPTGADNKYLFRLAQRGIRNFKVQDNPNFNFKFEEYFIPNVVARAVYFNGKTYYESESNSAVFNKEDKKLSISLIPDKESYKPSDEVKIGVEVKNKDGKGQKGEVNLSLVDEAVFSLMDQSVDTLKDLYETVSSGVISSYLSHQYPASDNPAEGGGCFLAGTKILIPRGKSKNIEELKVGDYILTREGIKSSKLVEALVTKTFKHTVGQYLVINEKLRVTPEHNLFVNGRFMVAEDVRVGDSLLDDQNNFVYVYSVERKMGNFKVYNLEIEEKQTFFADGFYVHNQKGRELFADLAYFGSVKTGSDGKGNTSFKLPDNLTSWRVTYQAISEDLGAGSGTKPLYVKLPFFVDVVASNEYLTDDEPVIKLRSFGEELKDGAEVSFVVKAPTLGITEQKLSSKAYEAVDLSLSNLSIGEHEITVSAKSGKHEDTIVKTIKVYDSRLVKRDSNYQILTNGIRLVGSSTSNTNLVFSDADRGKYYSPLVGLSYSFGDRIDQKLARYKARELLKTYFNNPQNSEDEEIRATNYQTPDGGISLFPYSDDDLELSAKVAFLGGDLVDSNSLKQYFYKVLDDKESGQESVSVALSGLASLNEPVLTTIEYILERSDLSEKDKLYLAIGEAYLGNREKSREILKNILEKKGEEFKPNVRVNVGNDQDDILSATALASVLAAMLDDESAEGLFGYTTSNYTKDILVYFEQILYLANKLPYTSGVKSKFAYTLSGKRTEVELKAGETHKLIVNSQELNNIKLESIEGMTSIASDYKTPFSSDSVKKDETISLTRTFAANGVQKTDFNQTDLIQVTLNYNFGQKVLDGCYQVTDFIPSGMRIVNRSYTRTGLYSDSSWYPYEIKGQKVSFCTSKGNLLKPIKYYARVVSKGEYKAENAIIQSLQSIDSFNISDLQKVKIQ